MTEQAERSGQLLRLRSRARTTSDEAPDRGEEAVEFLAIDEQDRAVLGQALPG